MTDETIQINSENIVPLKFVIKFSPPIIGLLYKPNKKENKKHIYNILLNELINIPNPLEITRQLFIEHSIILNPKIINPQQVNDLVEKILQVHMDENNDNEEYEEDQNFEDVDEEELLNQQGNYFQGKKNKAEKQNSF